MDCGQTGGCDLGEFLSVGCGSSTTCTAVGSGSGEALGEDWNGTTWRFDSTGTPPAHTLGGVWCTSATHCLAVGDDQQGMVAATRNGSRWTMRTIPRPSGATYAAVTQVSCSASDACTAVGSAYGTGGEVPLAERWDGTSWSRQAVPAPAGATLAYFNYVWCSGASACSAVGTYVNGAHEYVPLAGAWNGTRWLLHTAAPPNGATYGVLNGVSCRSAVNCTAVGSYTDDSGHSETLAEHWNGHHWAVQPSPNPAGSNYNWLNAVSCPSAAVCRAVGASSDGALAEGWNGTRWAIEHTPDLSDDPAHSAVLNDLACTPQHFCMAAGSYSNGSSCQLTLAERWNGSTWTRERTLTQMAILDTSLPAGQVGESPPYSGMLSACGAPSPFTWSYQDHLPTGLSLNAGTGTISGTPKYAGTSNFTITAASSDPYNRASASQSITVNASKPPTTWTVQSDGNPMNAPQIGFILVGNWWCAVTGLGSSSLCTFKNGYPYNCPKFGVGSLSACHAEGRSFETAENHLIATDYSASSYYFQQLQYWYCYPDCVGQSLVRRLYNGKDLFYGPITTQQAATPGPTLNSHASAWGIQSQDDASNTVFVFLYAPNLACGSSGSGNSAVAGGTGQYGFVFADVYLEDYAKNCNGPTGQVTGADLNLQSPEQITPENFATYATSHEVDEAITSPGQQGWVVPSAGGQIADPCTDRTQNGNSVGYDSQGNGNNWPYYNFTRDDYGTVVAAFVQFSNSAETCYPDVSTSVPPG